MMKSTPVWLFLVKLNYSYLQQWRSQDFADGGAQSMKCTCVQRKISWPCPPSAYAHFHTRWQYAPPDRIYAVEWLVSIVN